MPPSPRTPSVTRMPRTLGGQTMPVGWNCMNSMSISSAPAQSASAWPSPVYSHEFDVIFQRLADAAGREHDGLRLEQHELPGLAPVAEGAGRRGRRPSAGAGSCTPCRRRCPRWTPCCWSVRIISRPVRSPTCARRAYRWPPKSRWRMRPSFVRSKSAPHSSSSWTRSGAFLRVELGHAPVVQHLAAAHRVAEVDLPVVLAATTLPSAAAMPPSAMTVCALPRSDLQMSAVFDAQRAAPRWRRAARRRRRRSRGRRTRGSRTLPWSPLDDLPSARARACGRIASRHQKTTCTSRMMPMATSRTYTSVSPTQMRLIQANSM